MTISERFWARVAISGPDDCWLWQGGTDKDGYGKFRFRNRHWRAHRLAFILGGRALSPTRMVLHTCDTPACVNPAHLYAGTAADNMRDCLERDRYTRTHGTRNGQAKLSTAAVAEIRARVCGWGEQRKLAHEFGVSEGLISLIRAGKVRAHA